MNANMIQCDPVNVHTFMTITKSSNSSDPMHSAARKILRPTWHQPFCSTDLCRNRSLSWFTLFPLRTSGTAGSHSQKWKVPLCASSCASLLQFLALFVFTCERKPICLQCQLSGFLVWCRRVWRGSAVFCKFVTVQITEDEWWLLTTPAKDKGCSQRDRKLENGLLNCDVYICLHLGRKLIMMISDRKQM